MWQTVLSIWALLVFFSCCRRRPNSPVLSERSRIAAKPSTGQKVHRLTPTLGVTQCRGKNRTFLMKAHTEDDLQVITGFWEGEAVIVMWKVRPVILEVSCPGAFAAVLSLAGK